MRSYPERYETWVPGLARAGAQGFLAGTDAEGRVRRLELVDSERRQLWSLNLDMWAAPDPVQTLLDAGFAVETTDVETMTPDLDHASTIIMEDVGPSISFTRGPTVMGAALAAMVFPAFEWTSLNWVVIPLAGLTLAAALWLERTEIERRRPSSS